MTRPVVFGLLVFALSLATAPPADAQQTRCAPRAQVLEMIQGRFGETRRAIGLTSGASVMELYASDSTGGWSLVVTHPSGMSCLVGAGTGFEVDDRVAQGAPT